MADNATLLRILDLARWAPSGDNTQPWRFEIVSDDHIAIHGHDTRDHVLYDFDGHPSQMAHGALLETLRLAATRFGLAAAWTLRPACPETHPIYDVRFTPHTAAPERLANFIESRCVQRRPMHSTPLTPTQRQALEEAVGPSYSLQFYQSFGERLAVAKLLWQNAHIRLICPEAYPVHRDIIEWRARYSEDRIPDQAVGVDPATAKLMAWVMQRWERVDFFNRYLLGTIPPRVQLDFIPALACSAHILVLPRQPLTSLTDYVATGVAMQRLWLTVASLGFHLQPEMTPVIFRWYAQAGRPLSQLASVSRKVPALAAGFDRLTGADTAAHFAFFCRIGVSTPPKARSLRRSLSDLIISSPETSVGKIDTPPKAKT